MMKGKVVALIKMQHDEFNEVRIKLNAWGRWLRATKEANLDIKSGFSPGSMRDEEYDDEEAEVIEEILTHLKREVKLAYKVIEQDYYFENSAREGADRLNIKRTMYCDMKRCGETFVLSYLVSIRNFTKLQKSA